MIMEKVMGESGCILLRKGLSLLMFFLVTVIF